MSTATPDRTFAAGVELGGKAPVIDAAKLQILGRIGRPGHGPLYAALGDREFLVKGVQAEFGADDAPRPGVVLLGRMVTEVGSEGRRVTRRQVLEAVDVPPGQYQRLAEQRQRIEAGKAARRERATREHFVDALADLAAMKGRQRNIIPLTPGVDALGGVRIGTEARKDLGLRHGKISELVIPEEAPRSGIAGGIACLRERNVRLGGARGSRLILATSNLSYEIKELVKALGEDVLVAARDEEVVRCAAGHKGLAPEAFTIADPFGIPVCLAHLEGDPYAILEGAAA